MSYENYGRWSGKRGVGTRCYRYGGGDTLLTPREALYLLETLDDQEHGCTQHDLEVFVTYVFQENTRAEEASAALQRRLHPAMWIAFMPGFLRARGKGDQKAYVTRTTCRVVAQLLDAAARRWGKRP